MQPPRLGAVDEKASSEASKHIANSNGPGFGRAIKRTAQRIRRVSAGRLPVVSSNMIHRGGRLGKGCQSPGGGAVVSGRRVKEQPMQAGGGRDVLDASVEEGGEVVRETGSEAGVPSWSDRRGAAGGGGAKEAGVAMGGARG